MQIPLKLVLDKIDEDENYINLIKLVKRWKYFFVLKLNVFDFQSMFVNHISRLALHKIIFITLKFSAIHPIIIIIFNLTIQLN